MKKLTLLFLFISISTFSQESIKEVLKKYNNESIPYISVQRLQVLNPKTVAILDAREQKEFDVSHIKNAIHVGYDNFDMSKAAKNITDKNLVIVVYCTLGVRSEDVAEKLKEAGYKNVYNLFGGIVEWKNKGNSVVDAKGVETERVHVSSKTWGKWLQSGKKVYE